MQWFLLPGRVWTSESWLCAYRFLTSPSPHQKTRKRQAKTTGQVKRSLLTLYIFFIYYIIFLLFIHCVNSIANLEEVIACISCPKSSNSPSGKERREARQVKDKPRPRTSQAKYSFITFLEKWMTSQVNSQAKTTLKRLQFSQSQVTSQAKRATQIFIKNNINTQHFGRTRKKWKNSSRLSI